MIDAPRLKTLGRTAVMVPHMDDEVIGCGGLLARESDLSSTHLVFFNDGVSKYAGGREDDFRIRCEESRAAAAVLGVPESNLLFLGIPSRVLRAAPRERVDWLRDWIKENRIERVLIPFRYDRHPDHLATHRLTVKALTGIAHDIEVWEYFVYFRWRLLPKGDVRRYLKSKRRLDFDIGDVTETKRKALECFKSQTTVVAGRDRPVLSAEYVRLLLAEPEIFLVSSSARTMGGVFTIPEPIIRIAHYVEPRLKLWKDGIRRFVATRVRKDHGAQSCDSQPRTKLGHRLRFIASRMNSEKDESQPEEITVAGDLPRVCLVTESYWPVVGGLESQIATLSGALASQGYRQIILTRRSDRESKREETRRGIVIYRVGPGGKVPLARWLMMFTCGLSLFRLRREYDVILVGGFRTLGLPAVIVSRIARKSCILRAASNGEMSGEFFREGLASVGLKPESKIVRALLKWRARLLARSDGFVGISSHIRREFEVCGIAGEKIFAIPNPVDLTRFRPATSRSKLRRKDLGVADDGRLVIYTGRLVRYKGLPLLLDVWKEICAEFPAATLLLVGGGGADMSNCESDLKRFVAANALDRRVLFTGDVSDVENYLRMADIFVFPTQNEAFGISLIEAMACGLPAVASATGGILDIVADGKDGLLVAPGNREELHARLRQLLADPELAQAIGQNATATVRERYAAEAVAARYSGLFRRIQAGNNR